MKRARQPTARQKKCRACKRPFQPSNSLQVVCSPSCAIAMAKAGREEAERKAAKEARRELKARKAALKPRKQWLKEAQAAFNAWVRERDHDQPCISCGRFHEGQWHAGHYRTVGANPELRFEPLNVHKQCAPCNNHKSGDIVNYRINLATRIGTDKVEWLEGPHPERKWTVDEIIEIKRHYARLARELKKRRETA